MLVAGIIVGFIAMAFLSFMPILGPILAGFMVELLLEVELGEELLRDS